LHLIRAKSSCPATMAHCLPFFSCRSQSTAVPRSCFPTPQSVAFDTGEPPRRRCAGELPPRCCPSPSVRFQGRHLVAPLHLGPWMHPMRTFPPTIQPPPPGTHHALSAPSPRQSGFRVCPARHVSSDVGRLRAALWAMSDQVVPRRRWAAQTVCTVRVGQPCGFRLVHGVLNKNPFVFILNSIQIQTLEIHISLLRAPIIMKSVLLDS
jgi:hypothetical protein